MWRSCAPGVVLTSLDQEVPNYCENTLDPEPYTRYIFVHCVKEHQMVSRWEALGLVITSFEQKINQIYSKWLRSPPLNHIFFFFFLSTGINWYLSHRPHSWSWRPHPKEQEVPVILKISWKCLIILPLILNYIYPCSLFKGISNGMKDIGPGHNTLNRKCLNIFKMVSILPLNPYMFPCFLCQGASNRIYM